MTSFYKTRGKRFCDFLLASLLLVVAAPLLLIIALAVRLTCGWPVLFAQQRPGRNGKIFTLFKFRTMRGAKQQLRDASNDAGRVTPIGRLLRSTSLDELPELWNVVRGEMSLVGPRPLLCEYLPLYSARQARRHEVRPGITGLAQVRGRNAIDWEMKLEFDVAYVDRVSFSNDFRILLETVVCVLRHDGINAAPHCTMPPFTGKPRNAAQSQAA